MITPVPTGEARILTVAFTDLVDSTALLSNLDKETSERLLEEHFAILRRTVSFYGGQEIKTTGDGLMLSFASVTAGVRCAVALQQAVHEQDRWRRRHSLQVRIGVSAGEISARAGDLFGAAVVEASRLCAAAQAGQILTADIVRLLLGPNTAVTFVDRGLLELKGLPAPLAASEVAWEPDAAREVRAVLADDSVLFREGVARLLEEYGVRVVAQAGDLDGLLACVGAHRPELAVTDVRMPPTHSTEGVQAAERIRAEHPEVRVLLLSQHAEPTFALRLAEQGTAGFGYLLKERVIDIGHFGRLARRVATGGIAIDAEVVDTLIARQRRRGGLAVLADAELALLRGLAQGEQGDELSEALGIEADGMSEAIGAVLERLGVPAEDQAEPVIASLRVLAR